MKAKAVPMESNKKTYMYTAQAVSVTCVVSFYTCLFSFTYVFWVCVSVLHVCAILQKLVHSTLEIRWRCGGGTLIVLTKFAYGIVLVR